MTKIQNQARKPFALLGLMAVAAMMIAGCSGADEAVKIDPSKQNTGNVVAGLTMTGKTTLGEEEGTVDKIANVGERVDYEFTVKNVSKAKLTAAGVSTTQGQMWCKTSGAEGKALDLDPGAEMTCSTAGLPEAATKDAEVAKTHQITAEDVTAKVFEVIAKGHAQNPSAKDDKGKVVVAEPLALKVATVAAG